MTLRSLVLHRIYALRLSMEHSKDIIGSSPLLLLPKIFDMFLAAFFQYSLLMTPNNDGKVFSEIFPRANTAVGGLSSVAFRMYVLSLSSKAPAKFSEILANSFSLKITVNFEKDHDVFFSFLTKETT